MYAFGALVQKMRYGQLTSGLVLWIIRREDSTFIGVGGAALRVSGIGAHGALVGRAGGEKALAAIHTCLSRNLGCCQCMHAFQEQLQHAIRSCIDKSAARK